MPAPDTTTELLRGRGEGLTMAALALGAVSFINLLGAEKALLTIVLAILGMRATRSGPARARGWMAIGLAVLQLAVVVTVLVLFRDKLGQLITLLHDLS